MSNFSNFIEEDIEAKKVLVSTLPTNNKTNIKKYNAKIDSVASKYEEYKKSLKKYLESKSKSFNEKPSEVDIEKLSEAVGKLERVRFILNPTNTYFEKMGFDNLLYEISNYYDFNFDFLNEVIIKFLDKFKMAGINLKSIDFDYTCYVFEYMKGFLESKESGSYTKVAEIFEKIYWVNPEIIQHIELNFRKLIKKHEKNFNDYINKSQLEVMRENGIKNYDECLDKLKEAYEQLYDAKEENVHDIIELAKNGSIDINNYFKDSRVRTSTYSTIMVDSINLDNVPVMDKFYEKIIKLKINIEEYRNYTKFISLIDSFKKEYEKQIPLENDKSDYNKQLKEFEVKISNKELKLEKLNKKISNNRNEKAVKQLKIDSIKEAKELYDLYKQHDEEYFKYNVMKILTKSLTVAELLNFYYSFDYFKKQAIKKVFDITNYDEIKKLSDNFDLFAMNLENVIIQGIFVFEEVKIDKIIINKYRLDNININQESLSLDDLDTYLEKLEFLLRINKIEKSSTTVEKIWFQTQVENFKKLEEK